MHLNSIFVQFFGLFLPLPPIKPLTLQRFKKPVINLCPGIKTIVA